MAKQEETTAIVPAEPGVPARLPTTAEVDPMVVLLGVVQKLGPSIESAEVAKQYCTLIRELKADDAKRGADAQVKTEKKTDKVIDKLGQINSTLLDKLTGQPMVFA